MEVEIERTVILNERETRKREMEEKERIERRRERERERKRRDVETREERIERRKREDREYVDGYRNEDGSLYSDRQYEDLMIREQAAHDQGLY